MSTLPIRKSLPNNTFNYPFKKNINSPHNVTTQIKIVRLVGNMQKNINQLIQTISCQCGANIQFYQIAKVYCNKIQKLRKQRDQYKQKYQQAKKKLQLYESNDQYMRKYWEFKGLDSVDEQKINYKNEIQQLSQQNLLLSDRSSYLQKPPTVNKIQKDKSLKSITKKLNITPNPQQQDYYETDFLRKKLGMNLQNINEYVQSTKQQRNTPKMVTKNKLSLHNQNYKITKRDQNRQNGVIKGYKKQKIKVYD